MINITFKNLDIVKQQLSKQVVDKELSYNLGLAKLQLHASLRYAVKRNYTINKSLDSVLLDKSTSTTKLGVNFLENDLSYKDENLRLAEFITQTELGNINPGASKQGYVATAVIRRNRPKTVFGLLHFGGFLQKQRPGSPVGQVFERLQQATWLSPGVRAPFRPLYAIGLAKMAEIMFKYDSQVQKDKDTIVQDLASNLKI